MNELFPEGQSCFGWIKRVSCHENSLARCEHIHSLVRGSCFTTESRTKRPYSALLEDLDGQARPLGFVLEPQAMKRPPTCVVILRGPLAVTKRR